MSRRITTSRAALALAVAVATDLLQLPLVLAGLAALVSGAGVVGDLPIEALDVAIDAVTALLMYLLLGFHWLLLPTAAIELLPGIAAAPTWTACVLIVVWRSRRGAGPDVPHVEASERAGHRPAP